MSVSAGRSLDREKTQMQETGRLSASFLTLAELAEIVTELGMDPDKVVVVSTQGQPEIVFSEGL